ncbi:MAG TPA: hypothetical protein VII79_06490 [Candidatus Dormibacteraeota bacterium]|jgi:hypothetical protein
MLTRRIAGFLLIAGGVLMLVGVFPTWATVAATGASQDVNGFTTGSANTDAVVSFVAGGLLVFIGWAVSNRGRFGTRMFAFAVSALAVLWAGLIALLLGGVKSELSNIAGGAVTTTLGVGYYLTAGGAALAFLGGLFALAVRRARKPVTAPAQPDGVSSAASPQPVTAPPPGPQSTAPATPR